MCAEVNKNIQNVLQKYLGEEKLRSIKEKHFSSELQNSSPYNKKYEDKYSDAISDTLFWEMASSFDKLIEIVEKCDTEAIEEKRMLIPEYFNNGINIAEACVIYSDNILASIICINRFACSGIDWCIYALLFFLEYHIENEEMFINILNELQPLIKYLYSKGSLISVEEWNTSLITERKKAKFSKFPEYFNEFNNPS
jgi:hypothetical protein